MPSSFVHLHLHSEYSLVDGIVRLSPLVKAVAACGMPALALTDQSNLFALVKFYRAAQAAGVKPIVGVDAWVIDPARDDQPTRLVLLCRNETGYRHLARLVTRSYLEGQQHGLAVIHKPWLTGYTEGLIALSGGCAGNLGRALLGGQRLLAKRLLDEWLALFPESFYLELQRTGRPSEEEYINEAIDLALTRDAPVVATNDVRFLTREDFEAHEARVCIFEGCTLADPRRPRLHSEQQYLRSPQEMAEVFADIPEALGNTLEIAQRCNFELELGGNVLPSFPVPEGNTPDAYLRGQAERGLERRLARLFDPQAGDFRAARQPYDGRLERELKVICEMGFPGYFLIVADFIRWSKEHGIPVGPGRGSGAGSLVAYALGITDLDPMRYELLFERFLNPERVSMPDFDVDFCMEGRDRVIEYVAHLYGKDRVCQIITHGSMAARAVVRDVGRVLGHPVGFVDHVAKLIPMALGMTLEKALTESEELREVYEAEEDVHSLIDLARKLEGLVRNAGKHAGGVVIAPSALTDYMPLYCEPLGQSVVTQFDKDDVEAVGLVKFDFLGLRTLTIIDWAVQAINRRRAAQREGPIDINAIPMDDAAAFELLKRCATTAVFQLESRGMKELIQRLQPDNFEEIVALMALYRPGPLQSGMVDDFINRKHGRAHVDYPHPDLEPILRPTYGVILYQEQVMQIAQVLSGYTLGGADLLRRAMGKKKPEEMAKQRSVFLKGAQARAVEGVVANHIFDLMEKFAGYGFNKSHSVAYALLSYQTLWLKAHYPAHFMAAVLSSDMDNTDKVVSLIDECTRRALRILPPDVNRSGFAFTAAGDDGIVYGLGAIKGAGKAAIEGMIAEREANGLFTDLFDFCHRIDLRKANRRVLEALIRAGALDGLGPNRATLMASLPQALATMEQHLRDTAAGQVDLFGLPSGEDRSAPTLVTQAEWTDEERLTGEKETLGLYLTGHPIARYEEELSHITTGCIAELNASAGRNGNRQNFDFARDANEPTVIIAGLVVALRTRNTRSGRMAFATLDDRSGRIDVIAFNDVYRHYRKLLAKDRLLVVEGTVSADEVSGGYRMNAERILDIDQARELYARRLIIGVDQAHAQDGFVERLADLLATFRNGSCPVWIDYRGASARTQLTLSQEWQVHPTDELLRRLKELVGLHRVRVVYE
jgi:DNA-directed DNA polymerase III (polc)